MAMREPISPIRLRSPAGMRVKSPRLPGLDCQMFTIRLISTADVLEPRYLLRDHGTEAYLVDVNLFRYHSFIEAHRLDFAPQLLDAVDEATSFLDGHVTPMAAARDMMISSMSRPRSLSHIYLSSYFSLAPHAA